MRDLDWRSFEILVVDDEEDNLDAFRFAFRKAFSIHYALGGVEALAALESLDAAVIVSDQRMPGMNGIEFLKRAKERRPDAVGILLTAYADLAVLIDAVNSGAVDRYLQKPWDSKELTLFLRQAIASFATVRDNRRLREQVAHYAGYLEREQRDPIDFGELSGDSAPMKEVSARIGEVAPTSSPVLVEGEQGAEKEVVARALHVGSPREERPFVKVICAAFRGEALERELAGWKRGAFDGAFDDRAGRLELADGGTLYLEEPRGLSTAVQARLLRLLAEGEVERVGAHEPARVDVRLIVSLTPAVEAFEGGEALPELASRLSVFPIVLPPLRDRPGDVRPLAEHFLRKYARRNPRAARALSTEALAKLAAYAWPGNVRELENVIERAAILARGDVIQPEQLAFTVRKPDPALFAPGAPPAVPAAPPSWPFELPVPAATTTTPTRRVVDLSAPPWPGAADPPKVEREPEGPDAGRRKEEPRLVPAHLDTQLDDLERRELLAALARCGGNKAEVARSLGVQRTTLYYRLKRLGIDA